ncbi:WD domain, G-beta repeat [Vibrio aerogenes CECT 7868]|uniref:WD domain, G-beta repeat n=1 Tax=Vibrio aerogenes CECT 7868 TaxID=1216006 RepID=A0A1M6E9F2_9VIBR|nr:PQQ-binding-like beta-propeller repeat protein [Vibrio aerogenes]SHI82092.1 WD domain, G-beta repeat [Vibrio aerogenes CECT 7868]
MRIFSLYIPIFIVSILLNGCFFSPSPVQQWKVSPEGVTAFGLSRDGRFALTYSPKKQLILWDLTENKQLADLGALNQKESTVTKIRISDNDRYAVTAGQTNFAVWDLAWTQAKGLWSISDGIIRDIDLSKNGTRILMGLSNGKAIYVDLTTGRRMEFLAHREKVNSVALSANGHYALTGGNDYIAYLWDTKTGHVLRKFDHEQRVVRVALQRDGKYAFTSDGGNQARIWDLQTGKELSHLKSFSRQLIFSSARFSESGDQLITGTPSGNVMVWNSTNGDKLAEFKTQLSKNTRPPRAVVYDVAFNEQGLAISANSAGIAEAWQVSE